MGHLPTHVLRRGLLILLPVCFGKVYVETGSDISLCNMKCPEPQGALELYRTCRGEEEDLLEYFCKWPYTKNHQPSRLHLDTISGCWALTHAEKSDSCVYKTYYYGHSEYLLSSTVILVLDPVLITNITSNGSRLGEDIAVSVHYSGEESAVTWELEVESFPERYRLIDDNRTLIIPNVRREDAQRTFRVMVTNPINNETREYRLSDDPNFLRMLKEEEHGNNETGVYQPEIRDLFRQNRALVVVGAAVAAVAVLAAVTLFLLYRYRGTRRKRRDTVTAVTAETGPLHNEEHSEDLCSLSQQDEEEGGG